MRGGAKCPAVKIRDWSFKLNRKGMLPVLSLECHHGTQPLVMLLVCLLLLLLQFVALDCRLRCRPSTATADCSSSTTSLLTYVGIGTSAVPHRRYPWLSCGVRVCKFRFPATRLQLWLAGTVMLASQTFKTKGILEALKRHPWTASSALVVHNGDLDPNVFLACRNLHGIDFIPQMVCVAVHVACAPWRGGDGWTGRGEFLHGSPQLPTAWEWRVALVIDCRA